MDLAELQQGFNALSNKQKVDGLVKGAKAAGLELDAKREAFLRNDARKVVEGTAGVFRAVTHVPQAKVAAIHAAQTLDEKQALADTARADLTRNAQQTVHVMTKFAQFQAQKAIAVGTGYLERQVSGQAKQAPQPTGINWYA